MGVYRVCTVDENNNAIKNVSVIQCRDDEDAIQRVKPLVDGQDIELWEGMRLVSKFKSVDSTAGNMSRIMVRCPQEGARVWTGLTADVAASLPDVATPLQFPLCGNVHKWRPYQAWLEDAAEEAAPQSATTDGRR